MPVTSNRPRVPITSHKRPLSKVSQGVQDLTTLLHKISIIEGKLAAIWDLITAEDTETEKEWPEDSNFNKSSPAKEEGSSIAK